MKYDSNTKRSRNNAVVRMRKEQPELSLKEIGQVFGISAQRTWRIIKRESKNA